MKRIIILFITLFCCTAILCSCDSSGSRDTSSLNSTAGGSSSQKSSQNSNKGGYKGSFQNDLYVDSSDIINSIGSESANDIHESYSIDSKSYPKPCTSCHGTGTCDMCNGFGYYRNPYDISQTLTCTSCGGDGKCKYCNGTGTL